MKTRFLFLFLFILINVNAQQANLQKALTFYENFETPKADIVLSSINVEKLSNSQKNPTGSSEIRLYHFACLHQISQFAITALG